MKFTHAVHLLDADGQQITAGVTRGGDVYLLVMDGTGTARLTPELADRQAAILHDLARRARGPRMDDAELAAHQAHEPEPWS
jgi:hypothetical protein